MTLPPLPDLKPCPFCGSTNISTDDARDFVSCLDCYTEGPCNLGQGSTSNVEAWNRRAAIAAHVPEAAFGNIAAVPAQPLTDEQIHESLCEACSDGSGPVSLAEFRQDEAFADMVAFTRALERRIAAAPQAVPVPAGWVDSVMEQAQVFASAWSLVGGKFDNGSMLEEAQAAKAELRAMLAAAPKEQPHE